ncbi:MFS transporter [Nocardioides sp. LHD-245]|uniref:MFS transporter n=1 Tax=Nocardioides sp. LHD-245 TaxID=3051387 RepID=UPI0027E1B1E2|nr:MFS transporter [Nocardioides sp. LHD-245]
MNRPAVAALSLTSVSTFVAMVAYAGPLGNATTLTAAFAASPAATTWLLSSMSVGLAVGLLPAGALADLTGRRRVFVGGALVLAAGSVLCAVAGDARTFVAGRVIEGLGAAGVIATGLGLVAAVTTDPAHRARSAAWWGGSMGLGIAGGPLLTGLFDLGELWPATYLLLAAAGVAMAVAARHCFVESEVDPGRRMDLAGAALMAIGLTALLVTLVEARRGDLGVAVTGAAVALVTLAGFAVVQLRRRHPMLEPALLRHRGFTAAALAAVGTGAGVIALMSFSGTFATGAMGLTSLQAGALLALWSATSAVAALALRPLALRLTGTTQLAVGLVGAGVGLLMLSGLGGPPSALRLAPGLIVAGVASGLLNGGLGRQAIATVPAERSAVGTGVNNTARYVGAAVGTTLVSVLAATPHASAATQVAGWNHVTLLAGAISFGTAVAIVAIDRGRRAEEAR